MSTNFSGQLYQFDSVPVASAGIPFLTPAWESNSGTSEQQYGRYYWVGKGGDDNNDGSNWEKRKATIAAAITLANADIDSGWAVSPWAPSAVIVIAPGKYAENLTAMPYGCTIVGLGDAFDLNGERGVTIKPASGSPVDCTSIINSRIQNICFESADTSPCFDVENFNRNIVEGCLFAGNTSNTTSHCFRVKDETNADGNGDMTGSRFINCVFHRGVIGFEVETDNGSSKQASGNIIEHCYFTGCSAKGIYFHADCVPSFTVINHCVVGDGSTTLALGLDDDTTSVGVSNTVFQATANDPATASGGKYNGCYLNGALLTQS